MTNDGPPALLGKSECYSMASLRCTKFSSHVLNYLIPFFWSYYQGAEIGTASLDAISVSTLVACVGANSAVVGAVVPVVTAGFSARYLAR